MKKTMIGAMIAILLLATAAIPAVADTPARKVELKVFMSFPRFKDRIEKYLDVFRAREKAEKNIDVTVKLEMPNSDQALPILRVRMAANDAPDVFTLHAVGNVPEFYRGGYLSDLSDQPFVKKLHPGVRKTVTYDGKIVALPLESLSWGYMYNKKIFVDLKLTPPQTLSEMRTVVAKLKAAKVTPFLLSFQESWIPQLMMALSLGGVTSSAHPDFVERMNKGVGSYKEVSEVFDIIDLILANGTAKPFETGSSNGSADFANGKAAMWVQGPWMSERILKANPDFQIGVAPLPVNDNPAATMINVSTSTSLAVSPTSKNRDVALDLINFFLDDKESSALFQDLQFNPVATIHTYPTMPWTKEAMEYVAKGRAYQDPSLPNAVTDETAKLLQSYYLKETTKSQIIDRLDKTWAKAVKTAK